MKRILIVLVLVLVFFGGNSVSNSSTTQPSMSPTKPISGGNELDGRLPTHTVASNTSLSPKDGRRIEIHVSDINPTKDECEQLINAYKNEAGSRAKYQYCKPNKSGELRPWCVDNMDGNGISFNDFHFE
ncbi:MAG: hypothetical protein IPJ94_27975 [Chloroflexi bacterium]|nr:hypothetical protein [Chloroflexota bacterium]